MESHTNTYKTEEQAEYAELYFQAFGFGVERKGLSVTIAYPTTNTNLADTYLNKDGSLK